MNIFPFSFGSDTDLLTRSPKGTITCSNQTVGVKPCNLGCCFVQKYITKNTLFQKYKQYYNLKCFLKKHEMNKCKILTGKCK